MTREKYDSTDQGGRRVGETGLAPVYIGAWSIVAWLDTKLNLCEDQAGAIELFSEDHLKPVQRYVDYITLNWGDDDISTFILEDSTTAAISMINALVEEFNDALPEIREEQDSERVLVYYNRAKRLIVG
jgi:hypothetical protein